MNRVIGTVVGDMDVKGGTARALVRDLKRRFALLYKEIPIALKERKEGPKHLNDYQRMCKEADRILHDRHFKRVPARYMPEFRDRLVKAAIQYAQEEVMPLGWVAGERPKGGRPAKITGAVLSYVCEAFEMHTKKPRYADVESLARSCFPNLPFKKGATKGLIRDYRKLLKRNPPLSPDAAARAAAGLPRKRPIPA